MFTETNLATNIAEAYYGYYEKSYTGVKPDSNENWTGGVATSVIKSAALVIWQRQPRQLFLIIFKRRGK